MDILVLAPTPSFPADQGNRARIANVCGYFANLGARIHFLYFPREWGGRFSRKEYDGIAAQWDYFDVIPPSKDFVYMTEHTHFGIDDWWDDNIANFIRWKTNDYSYDAFIVNYAFFSKAFEYVPQRTLKILDTHDRLGGRRELLQKHGIGPEFFYTTTEQEKVALDRADVVVAIAESEASYFRTHTNRPVLTIGHIINSVPRIALEPAEDGAVTFGILGSDNIVNVRNLADFFTHFFKLFPLGLPRVNFVVAGSCCNRLTEFLGKPGIKLLGRVESVESFYKSVDCIFVPFMFGTGQKIKVVEALAYGAPLIATESASDGTYSEAPAHNCKDFDEVIEYILKYANDPNTRRQLETATETEFARYRSHLEASCHSLFRLIMQKSASISVEPRALYERLVGRSRRELIESIIPLIPAIDAISDAYRISNKDESMAKIRAVSQALMRDDPTMLEALNVPPEAGSEHAGIVISFGDTRGSVEDLAEKILLNVRTEAFDLPDPASGDFFANVPIMLRTNWSQRAQRDEAPLKQMPPLSFGAHDKAVDGIVFLARSNEERDVGERVRETLNALEIIYRTQLPAVVIDSQGEIVHHPLKGAPIVQKGGDIDAYEILLKSRAQTLARHSIAVGMGISYSEMPFLLRMLANDCGPLLTLPAAHKRTAPLDGEVVCQSPREVALRVASLAACPAVAKQFSDRWRLAIGNLSWDWVFKKRLTELVGSSMRYQLQMLTTPAQTQRQDAGTDAEPEAVAVV